MEEPLSPRAFVLQEVSRIILNLKLAHPVRVGIDGITASGKSTFAKELSERLGPSNRTVISTTLDGFHHPKSVRYQRGQDSPEGYYYDAYNYPAVIENLLMPLGPSGNLHYRTTTFDLKKNIAIESEPQVAPGDAILVVDGSFALRGELIEHWDVGIYIDVDFGIAENRAAIRDAVQFGSSVQARAMIKKRYHGAHKIHAQEVHPLRAAHIIINNDEPMRPRIVARRLG